MISLILVFILSLAFWWLWFGVDMFLNGGTMGYPYPMWTVPFYHWWAMTLEHLPFVGKTYRYEHTGGIDGIYKGREKERQEWEDALWMPFYYIFMCWIVPFGPTIAFYVVFGV